MKNLLCFLIFMVGGTTALQTISAQNTPELAKESYYFEEEAFPSNFATIGTLGAGITFFDFMNNEKSLYFGHMLIDLRSYKLSMLMNAELAIFKKARRKSLHHLFVGGTFLFLQDNTVKLEDQTNIFVAPGISYVIKAGNKLLLRPHASYGLRLNRPDNTKESEPSDHFSGFGGIRGEYVLTLTRSNYSSAGWYTKNGTREFALERTSGIKLCFSADAGFHRIDYSLGIICSLGRVTKGYREPHPLSN